LNDLTILISEDRLLAAILRGKHFDEDAYKSSELESVSVSITDWRRFVYRNRAAATLGRLCLLVPDGMDILLVSSGAGGG
jgi:hypothetical protein